MSNSKKGLTHWPFDIHFWDDIKIRKLIKYQGGKAPQVFALLLCYIYEVGYYISWDEELPFILSEKLGSGYDEAYVLEVLNCCVSLGLLDKELYEKKILTSAAIQERWKDISESLRRKSKLEEYNLLESAVPPQNAESSHQNVESSPQNEVIFPTIEENRIEENRIEENRIEENRIEVIEDIVGDLPEIIDTPQPQKKLTLDERRQNFYNSLIPYVDKYGKTMIRAFYNYWSQVNEGGRKMAWEKCGTFELSKRLASWNAKSYNKDDGGQQKPQKPTSKGMTPMTAIQAALGVQADAPKMIDMNKLIEEQ